MSTQRRRVPSRRYASANSICSDQINNGFGICTMCDRRSDDSLARSQLPTSPFCDSCTAKSRCFIDCYWPEYASCRLWVPMRFVCALNHRATFNSVLFHCVYYRREHFALFEIQCILQSLLEGWRRLLMTRNSSMFSESKYTLLVFTLF